MSNLEKLLERKQKLEAKIKKAKAIESNKQRKADTRKKILWGALTMKLIESGNLNEKEMMKRLDGFLTKNSDRKLFNLPLKD